MAFWTHTRVENVLKPVNWKIAEITRYQTGRPVFELLSLTLVYRPQQ